MNFVGDTKGEINVTVPRSCSNSNTSRRGAFCCSKDVAVT